MSTTSGNRDNFDLRGHAILIVDDEPANLGMMSDYLGSFGLEVLIARDGESGLEKAQYAQPDLILLDVLMPGIDGFETCRRLKANGTLRDIPVIFMTGLIETQDKVRGFQLGAVDYITKPFQYDELLARITTHLRIRDLTRELEEAKEGLERRIEERTAELKQLNQKLQAEIAERRRMEEQRKAYVRFLESLEQVNRAVHQASDVEQMLRDGIETVHSIFGCDRAWLLYPCDPEAPTFRVPVEFTRPGYPGAFALDREIPMKPGADDVCAAALASEGPVTYGPDTDHPVYKELTEQFGVLSQMIMAVYPKTGKPWMFGMHQCSHPRVWTQDEQRLFKEIGRRTGDALTTLLILRDLRESEERFRALYEDNPSMYFTVEAQGTVLSVNPFGAEQLGYTVEELVGQSVFKVFYPDDQEAVRQQLTTCLQKPGQVVHWEFRKVRKDGSMLWVREAARAVQEPDGHPVVFIVCEDITERVQAEEARMRLATAIEQAAESVVITDTAGAILYVNPAFVRTSGYSRTEAIGQNPRLLKSGKQKAAFYEELWETITAGQVWHGRLINKKKDGSFYTEEATISPVRDERGVIVNYVAVKRDVTRELELEEQYYQAQKMEAIGQLTAGIAHDFNNLLTGILGFAELMKLELSPDDPLQESTERILSASRRAAGLVRQLLAFSRKQVIQPQVLNLNAVVGDTDKLLQRIIGEDVELKAILAPDLWPVKVDPTQIEQVIVNLTVNARDAMLGGGRLIIRTANVVLAEDQVVHHLEGQPGEYVLLTVSDTGVGMSKEVQAHLFEPFFTTKERGKGTGLGLSTVYGIVQQSDGHIWVDSEEGRGTTFKVYLPRAKEAGPLSFRPGVGKKMPTGNETILLVEDDAQVRELTRQVLQRQGYTVLEARDGQEALRLVAAGLPGSIHLLLTDVVMPGGMTGPQLATELVSLQPQMKVLYISGYTDNAIVHNGMLDPDIAFLPKPFMPDGLVQKVREVLETKEGASHK